MGLNARSYISLYDRLTSLSVVTASVHNVIHVVLQMCNINPVCNILAANGQFAIYRYCVDKDVLSN